MFPLTERYVPSAFHRAPFRQYPLTRHLAKRLASPSQLSTGKLNRCIYFFSWDLMETARDIALKDKAWALHHEDDRPYLTNALYAELKVNHLDCYPSKEDAPFNKVK